MKHNYFLLFVCTIIFATPKLFAQWIAPVPYFPNNIYSVNCIAGYNGNIVIGGSFSDESDCDFERVAMWNGSEWEDLGGGIPSISPGTDKSVYILTEFNGDLYAGGCFHNWDSSLAGLAKFNGTAWHRVSDSLYAGCTRAYWREEDTLYFGGIFTHLLSDTTSEEGRVMKIDKNGGMHYIPFPAMYSPDLSNVVGKVYCIAKYHDEIYIGGDFLSYDNPNIRNIARWDGSQWQAVGTGTDGTILNMDVYKDELFVSGGFGQAGDVATISNNQGILTPFGLAKWNGITWLPAVDNMLWSLSFGNLLKIGTYQNKLFISGSFDEIDGHAAQHVAYLEDTTWVTSNVGVTYGTFSRGFTAVNDTLYGVGSISINGLNLQHFSKYNPIIDTTTIIGIPSHSPIPLRLYPNPAQEQLYLHWYGAAKVERIIVRDIWGSSCLHIQAPPNLPHSIDIASLAQGQYFVQIYTHDNSYTARFVKK
ncbi:MAG: T9SS type A sorting domain-containing protein [Chitinophagales bacterium]|nr:T9SS type A sorting domain-containing protein [Chitinophagales bacterium]